ncbi:hypothetical protein D6F12_23730 [Salmonella enterica]|nr:hypothetical protein [Salmonella enterica]HAU2970430.1 hypothetical protein [Salmonella enterica subsp. diarizonae]
MKKLIIAAGIAAATMASFNASADASFSDPSYASINTTVNAKSVLSVTTTDGETDVAGINKAGTQLGSFTVAQVGMDGLNYDKIAVEKIHTHGYYTQEQGDFNIVLSSGGATCEVGAGTHESSTTSSLGVAADGETCVFPAAGNITIDVKTGTGNTTPLVAGVKTITAQFRAFHL